MMSEVMMVLLEMKGMARALASTLFDKAVVE